MQSKLLTKTRDLLENRSVQFTYDKIGKAIGVTPRWVKHVATGGIAEPSVVKIEKLYEFLSGNQLQV